VSFLGEIGLRPAEGLAVALTRHGNSTSRPHSYFVSYEIVKKYLTPAHSEGLSLGAVILAGGTAGIAMWSIAIPPDVSFYSFRVLPGYLAL
jgi:solute carrier family 25 carnitine/acylcarnitine transporter 20/29